jgi:hypothetical protein
VPAAPAAPAVKPVDPNTGKTPAITVSKDALVNFTNAVSHTADDVNGAQQDANIDIGFPGPGLAGIPVGSAHAGVRNAGIDQVKSTHVGLTTWVNALQKVTGNWQGAEQGTQDFINGINIIAPPSM